MGILGFDNFLRLQNRDGTEAVFELLDMIEYDGSYYVVLLPEGEGQKNFKILQIEILPDDREAYVSLQREEVQKEVFRRFVERNPNFFEVELPQ